jgi:hypothetical protein
MLRDRRGLKGRSEVVGTMEIVPGTVIKFRRTDGVLARDTVRQVFWQRTLCEQGVAFVLTNHSWCWAGSVEGVLS